SPFRAELGHSWACKSRRHKWTSRVWCIASGSGGCGDDEESGDDEDGDGDD
ncbi:hypothetical protein Tco_0048030, partial [Tanacetum coccineum]